MDSNRFEHVKGTGHYGESEFYRLVPPADINREISEGANEKIFTNPDIIDSVREGRVQFIKNDGSSYTQQEIEEMVQQYQGGGRTR